MCSADPLGHTDVSGGVCVDSAERRDAPGAVS